jgi:hypothetical protein
VSELNSFVGKKIVVQLNSGFKKYGVLLSFDSLFLSLEFRDGKREIIPLASVGAVYLDEVRA